MLKARSNLSPTAVLRRFPLLFAVVILGGLTLVHFYISANLPEAFHSLLPSTMEIAQLKAKVSELQQQINLAEQTVKNGLDPDPTKVIQISSNPKPPHKPPPPKRVPKTTLPQGSPKKPKDNPPPVVGFDPDPVEPELPYSPTSIYHSQLKGVVGYDPVGGDPKEKEKRDFVRRVFRHAFHGYSRLCFGKGEVRPVSQGCNTFWREYSGSEANLGLTLIDSLDTMLIMGESHLYKRSRDWIAEKLYWNVSIGVSVFEVTIRCLGGLLSAHTLTKDPVLLQKAVDLGEIFSHAFDTPSGIPYTYVNLHGPYGPTRGTSSNMAEAGSLQLEFTTLSHLTKDPKFARGALGTYRSMLEWRPHGDPIFPKYIVDVNSNPAQFQGERSIGGEADSFYEYLMKLWVLTGKRDMVLQNWWHETADAIVRELVHPITIDGHDMVFISPGTTQSHLECFTGGMFALASQHADTEERKASYLKTAIGLGAFCRQFYIQRPAPYWGLPVEQLHIRTDSGHTRVSVIDDTYLQRPEAVETWFYLWRITGDPMYQEWGWDYARALESTKTPYGYHGLSRGGGVDDVQQSFFLAETLKYLYLLFCPKDVLPIDEFIFTTEAHPFVKFNPRDSYNLTLADIPAKEPPRPPPVPPPVPEPVPVPVPEEQPKAIPKPVSNAPHHQHQTKTNNAAQRFVEKAKGKPIHNRD